MNKDERALDALDYIRNLEFSSISEFVRKAAKDGRFDQMIDDVGTLPLYYLVCERLGITPDSGFAISLEETED